MSDPGAATQVNPHPVSGHRTPREIAEDEAGPIGHVDVDCVPGSGQTETSPRVLPQVVNDELPEADAAEAAEHHP